MARAPFAQYVGPTANQGGAMARYDGLVIHIAEGSYLGTIAWQKNPAADVSSHFVVAKDGRISQMVDTAARSWCQAAGNPSWLSVENEGFHGDTPPAAQLEALAQVYAWCIRTHHIPAQISNSPNVGGLGWHGMGGTAWGGHFDCPGEGLKNARSAILARANQINGGSIAPPTSEEDDMRMIVDPSQSVYLLNGQTDPVSGWPVLIPISVTARFNEYKAAGIPVTERTTNVDWSYYTRGPLPVSSGGGSAPAGPVDLTDAAVAKVADAVVDEEHARLDS